MTFEVRKADAGDCHALAAIQVDSYRTAYAGIFPPAYLARFDVDEQAQDWLELLASRPDDILLVAVAEGGQAVGYILARAEPDIYPDYDAEIIALHVRRSWQRKGAGYALFAAALAQLTEKECRRVMLWTLEKNPVRDWYERLGGQVIGRKNYEVDGWDVVEVAYGWADIKTVGPPEPLESLSK
jgi:GNAT superfamily N-acetyltransferase